LKAEKSALQKEEEMKRKDVIYLSYGSITYPHYTERRPSEVFAITKTMAGRLLMEWARSVKADLDKTYGDDLKLTGSRIVYFWVHCDGCCYKNILEFENEKTAARMYGHACKVVGL